MRNFFLSALLVSACQSVAADAPTADCVPVDKVANRPGSHAYQYFPHGLGELTADGDQAVLCTIGSDDSSSPDLVRYKCWTMAVPSGELHERAIVNTPRPPGFPGDVVTSTDRKHVGAFVDGPKPRLEIRDADTHKVLHTVALPAKSMGFQLAFLGDVFIAEVASPDPADPIPDSSEGLLAIKHVVLAIRDDGKRLPDLGTSFWVVDDHRVTAWDDYVQHLVLFDATTGKRQTSTRDVSNDACLLAEQACFKKPIAQRPPPGCKHDMACKGDVFDQLGLEIVPASGGYLIGEGPTFSFTWIDASTFGTQATLTAPMCKK